MANGKKSCHIVISSGFKVRIDREDRKRVSNHTWRVTEGTTGRRRVVTSIRKGEKIKTITLGKFLLAPPKGKQVYPRRFNNELDYRKSNLIVCTLKERQRLLPKKKIQTSSVFKGVSFNRKRKLWRAAIEVSSKSIYLGDFKTEEQAALAYNIAARKYFGAIAYQNPVGKKVLMRETDKS